MENQNAYLVPNPIGPSSAVFFDAEKCVGCNICVNSCRADVMMPNPEKGQPPLVVYPDECWFCGCCANSCPREAIRMEHPMPMRATWKRKETGEFFRIGAKKHPAPVTKPPVVD